MEAGFVALRGADFSWALPMGALAVQGGTMPAVAGPSSAAIRMPQDPDPDLDTAPSAHTAGPGQQGSTLTITAVPAAIGAGSGDSSVAVVGGGWFWGGGWFSAGAQPAGPLLAIPSQSRLGASGGTAIPAAAAAATASPPYRDRQYLRAAAAARSPPPLAEPLSVGSAGGFPASPLSSLAGRAGDPAGSPSPPGHLFRNHSLFSSFRGVGVKGAATPGGRSNSILMANTKPARGGGGGGGMGGTDTNQEQACRREQHEVDGDAAAAGSTAYDEVARSSQQHPAGLPTATEAVGRSQQQPAVSPGGAAAAGRTLQGPVLQLRPGELLGITGEVGGVLEAALKMFWCLPLPPLHSPGRYEQGCPNAAQKPFPSPLCPFPQVGCGKSSLLAALLGELQPLLPLNRAAVTAAVLCAAPSQPLSPVDHAAAAACEGSGGGSERQQFPPWSPAATCEMNGGGLPASHEGARVVLGLGAAVAGRHSNTAGSAPPQDGNEDRDPDLDLDRLAPVICGSIAYCSQVR